MRRLLRAAGVVALVASTIPLGQPARAADATLRVDKQGWFWQHTVYVNVDPFQEFKNATGQTIPCPPPPPAPPVPCPSVPQRVNPFEDDHLLVGRYADAPDEAAKDQAVSLLLFDITWIDPGTKVFEANMQLEESNDDFTGSPGANNPTNLGEGHPNRRPGGNVNSATAQLRACPVFDFWGGSQPTQPALWIERPKHDCGKAQAPGKREIATRQGRTVAVWTFDITPIAKLWGQDPFSAQGLAIVPAEKATGEWMVSLHGSTYVVQRDLVSQQDLSTTLVQRVAATMRYQPTDDFSAAGFGPPDGSGTTTATDVLGDALASSGLGLSLGLGVDGVSPVNSSLGVVPGGRGFDDETAFAGAESVPGYLWLPLLAGIGGLRGFMLLFLGGGRRREHRVAAASRRLRMT